MSFGCPLICSDVLAQKEIIEKYKVGELFKTENSNDFSKTVLELYKNSEKLKTYSLNCKIAIENHLNNEIVSQQIVSMYAK
jgi:glycosyltransferase involved in cell wall biosynthesis